MKKMILLFGVVIIVGACKKSSAPDPIIDKSSTSDLITDINDPGITSAIKIGTQKWMTTNLAVSRYRNGDRIPQVKDSAKWYALTTGAWCWYNNDPATGAVYGKLYNWYAVNDPRGLAPTGWHIPSDAEWDTLSTFLGGDGYSGGKMKETGTTHWYPQNLNATNSSGFTGLPGGIRYFGGTFIHIRNFGYWWSSTPSFTASAWYRYLFYLDGTIVRATYDKRGGVSVRCLRD